MFWGKRPRAHLFQKPLDICGYICIIIYVDTKEREVNDMSPRTGRPTDDPKNFSTRIRLSEEDVSMLEYCCTETGMKKSEIIRLGIRKVYDELKNKNS